MYKLILRELIQQTEEVWEEESDTDSESQDIDQDRRTTVCVLPYQLANNSVLKQVLGTIEAKNIHQGLDLLFAQKELR